MAWRPIRAKLPINVDWSGIIAASCVDPYLVWGDVTDFAGYEPGRGDTIPVLMEARLPLPTDAGASTPQWSGLQVAAFNGTHYLTGDMPKCWVKHFLEPAAQRWFPRFEYSAAARVSHDEVARWVQLAEPLRNVRSPVIAVIDDGCPFAHAALRRWDAAAGLWRTRVRLLWDQDVGRNAWDGTDLDHIIAANTQDGIVDERACYAALAAQMAAPARQRYMRRLSALASHGAHVLDVAAGHPNPLRRLGGDWTHDVAGECDVAFVQLPRSAVADTSGAAMNVAVLDALAFLGKCLAKVETVVNLSYGALAGPHDGSTLLESALDAMLGAGWPRALVLPAGNAYDNRTHAEVEVAAGKHETVRLHVLPADPTDTFVEFWYSAVALGQPDAVSIQFCVRSPDGVNHSGPVAVDRAVVDDPARPTAAMLHLRNPPAGNGQHMALLALAPTQRQPAGRPRACHGVWEIDVCNVGVATVVVRAWVERDDSAFGSGRSRSQARFLSVGEGSAKGHPHAASSPIKRTRTLNSFANGERPVVVGGYRNSDERMAMYSASGPGRLNVGGPDFAAPCEERVSSRGILAGGNRSAAPTRMDGTSVAAAAASRVIANRLADGTINPGRPLKDQLASVPLPVRPLPPHHPTPNAPELRAGKGKLLP